MIEILNVNIRGYLNDVEVGKDFFEKMQKTPCIKNKDWYLWLYWELLFNEKKTPWKWSKSKRQSGERYIQHM